MVPESQMWQLTALKSERITTLTAVITDKMNTVSLYFQLQWPTSLQNIHHGVNVCTLSTGFCVVMGPKWNEKRTVKSWIFTKKCDSWMWCKWSSGIPWIYVLLYWATVWKDHVQTKKQDLDSRKIPKLKYSELSWCTVPKNWNWHVHWIRLNKSTICWTRLDWTWLSNMYWVKLDWI